MDAFATPEYEAWIQMLGRCGCNGSARLAQFYAEHLGLSIWPGWVNDYSAFLAHIGPMPEEYMEVERIDSGRGYDPGNVRWASLGPKPPHVRKPRHFLHATIRGVTKHVAEWARISGIPATTLAYRIIRKWPEKELLSMQYNPERMARAGRKAGTANRKGKHEKR